MSTVAFDTLQFVETLEKSGIVREQATAMAEAYRNAAGEADLAIKRDILEMELKIESRFEQVKGELNLLKWMLGVLLALAITNFAK